MLKIMPPPPPKGCLQGTDRIISGIVGTDRSDPDQLRIFNYEWHFSSHMVLAQTDLTSAVISANLQRIIN